MFGTARMKLLDSFATRDVFEQELERVRRWSDRFVTGYVIMPERVHLLLSEPERGKLSGAGPTFHMEFPIWGCPTLPALFAGGWGLCADYNLHECTSNQSAIKTRAAGISSRLVVITGCRCSIV